ncbi:Pam16-domain-containing protein [Leucosporidium creatinivorum]|uniref:Mitochondrial import inner membrane translocase subunit TIM16 n=1 Tax=Leucosporidium creatinivorum TaxID=106004 RepID=A0A1Y2FYI1_9BASI|nr:Pam16-domain-containing protein [Leucosporidium creatinivorum]
MSAPRILAQVVILGSQILGKAFVQAWRQAARNAQASAPAGTQGGGAGGSAADAISRTHRMTIDEATQILNIKKGAFKEESELQKMLKNFDHLFAANAPLTAEGKPHSSHYLQSKIVRAKERIEAEVAQTRGGGGAAAAEGAAAEGAAAEGAAKEGASKKTDGP